MPLASESRLGVQAGTQSPLIELGALPSERELEAKLLSPGMSGYCAPVPMNVGPLSCHPVPGTTGRSQLYSCVPAPPPTETIVRTLGSPLSGEGQDLWVLRQDPFILWVSLLPQKSRSKLQLCDLGQVPLPHKPYSWLFLFPGDSRHKGVRTQVSGASLPFRRTISPIVFTPARAPRSGLRDTQLEALYQSQ